MIYIFNCRHIRAQLEKMPEVDIENDWKFMNLLIGANDACPLCWEFDRPTVSQAADSFEQVIGRTVGPPRLAAGRPVGPLGLRVFTHFYSLW